MDFLTVLEDFRSSEQSMFMGVSRVSDVERALSRPGKCTLADFKALISPAAKPYLEELASIAQELTWQRFGKTMQLYAPLYVSNECQNICTYCGFSFDNKIKRVTLSDEELRREALAVRALGFEHILLVSGEAQKTVGLSYFENALSILRKYFSQVSIEVQPLKITEYQALRENGLYGVMVYQETYDRDVYKAVHPKGRKTNFNYRLETPERLAAAGVHKIGLGVLLGLADWRIDSILCALHLDFLRKRFWKTSYSISFPRLRPAEGVTLGGPAMTESELVQLICAYRLFDPDVDISISTRERPVFRDNMVRIGVTTMSAGSRTEPGGYSKPHQALKQFTTSDERSPGEVAAVLVASGIEPVWKNWDRTLCVR